MQLQKIYTYGVNGFLAKPNVRAKKLTVRLQVSLLNDFDVLRSQQLISKGCSVIKRQEQTKHIAGILKLLM